MKEIDLRKSVYEHLNFMSTFLFYLIDDHLLEGERMKYFTFRFIPMGD